MKKKIIEFFGEPLSYGGQEAFVLNLYSHFKRDAQYTFVTPFIANNKELSELIQIKKDRLVADNNEFNSIKRKKSIYATAKKHISSGFDVVHVHSGSILTLLMVAFISKKKGVKRVIVHSHATGYKNIKHTIVKKFSDLCIEKYVDLFLACSKEAGEFKFPSNVINSNKFVVIKNGIDIDKYKYNESIRKKKREEFGIEGEIVLCNVGRYSEEKNQKFVLDVFSEYKKQEPQSRLIIAGGNGPLREEVERRIRELELDSDVILLSERNDINQILSAVDVFLFPSLFEGLGISAIEAQAAGLPTICSENVPDEAKVTNLFCRVPLEKGAKEWARVISELPKTNHKCNEKDIIHCGYSAEECAKRLEEIYFNGE